MSVPSLTERPLLALGGLNGGPRTQDRRRPDPNGARSERAKSDAQEPPAREEAGSLRPVFSMDLSTLAEIGEREALLEASEPTVAEFLAAFSTLLSSVSTGDVSAAREAANMLQLELFGFSRDAGEDAEGEEDAALRMLEDLVALIRFARLGDLGSAGAAAGLLARHMQTALLAPAAPPPPAERLAKRRGAARLAHRLEPPPLVQGATAAYVSQMDGEPGAGAA